MRHHLMSQGTAVIEFSGAWEQGLTPTGEPLNIGRGWDAVVTRGLSNVARTGRPGLLVPFLHTRSLRLLRGLPHSFLAPEEDCRVQGMVTINSPQRAEQL